MKNKLTAENVVLSLLSLTFFIGLWHGFPFTNVVADEMFFSGSVLRSIESRTIFPLPLDVPYGTITFYLSYVFIAVGLSMMSILYLFDISALKFFIIQNPYIVYGFARLLSFGLALFCLFGGNYVLKKYVSDYRTRLLILSLLFTNILVNVIFHTSKVWVLATMLMLTSFYFLVRVFETDDSKDNKKNIWYSIFFSFLSFANFPFMGMALVSVPIIFFKYIKHKDYRNTVIKAVITGAIFFILFLFSNFSGIKAQVYSIIFDYTLSQGAQVHNLTISASAVAHILKILKLFPILLFTWVIFFIFGKVRNHSLLRISLIYLVTYVILIIFVDRWSIGSQSSLRYLFPVPFFLTAVLASYDFTFKKLLYAPLAVSIIYLAPTLIYLSSKTTSHELVSFVRENFSDDKGSVIINNIGVDAPLPINKRSFLFAKEAECGSLCQATIRYDLKNDFKPLVFDSHTDQSRIGDVIKNLKVYYLERYATTSSQLYLTTSFTNPVMDNRYYSLDNSGNYFDLTYFKLRAFGPNIYMYEKI